MNIRRFAAATLTVGAAWLSGGCATFDDFTLTTTDGATISLSEQRGKAVLVCFWAVG